MEKKVLPETGGKFINGNWHVKNLNFLLEFMEKCGYSTGDIARAVGLQRQAVTRWLVVDDTKLSYVIKFSEAIGCDFLISYEVPEVSQERTNMAIDKALFNKTIQGFMDSRLAFLRLALWKTNTTYTALADKLGLSRSSVQNWLMKDDISFRYIYLIAEAMDWTVDIYFRAKEKAE